MNCTSYLLRITERNLWKRCQESGVFAMNSWQISTPLKRTLSFSIMTVIRKPTAVERETIIPWLSIFDVLFQLRHSPHYRSTGLRPHVVFTRAHVAIKFLIMEAYSKMDYSFYLGAQHIARHFSIGLGRIAGFFGGTGHCSDYRADGADSFIYRI